MSQLLGKGSFVGLEDLPHEEDVMRNAYSLKSWWRYLEFKEGAPAKVRYMLFERALKELPGSYKLWWNYISERRNDLKGKCFTHPGYVALNNTFERALVYMHKMPVIWVAYCTCLQEQKLITPTRRALDRALRALPVTQHDRIWAIYIPWVTGLKLPDTAIRVYQRYLKVAPHKAEDYVEFLLASDRVNEATHKLAELVDDPSFVSQRGNSKYTLWVKLCELLAKNPQRITGLKGDHIIRHALTLFTDEVGRLWLSLAEYYIRLGNFDKARDVFEEGIHTVMTVRDFSLIWDAYSRFEDSLIEARLQTQQDEEDDVRLCFFSPHPPFLPLPFEKTCCGDVNSTQLKLDFEMVVARYERLIADRPLLLSSVLLRQNPHNVHEWHKRVKLFPDDPVMACRIYEEAVSRVDPKKATGKPYTLWAMYAKLYEKNGDLDSARRIFRKAAQQPFRSVDELASVWCEFAEMELRNFNYQDALAVLREATAVPRITKVSRDDPVQRRLFKSTKLWAFYADLEESLGTFLSTKAVYDKILELRIATPQIVLNYAAYLEENKYYEESFKAYEKGLSAFRYPHNMDLWIAYITKFVERYQGEKLERCRDLFEQAVSNVPAEAAKTLYIMYGHVEEQYGLARHAMSVYDRACRAVIDADKPHLYRIYLNRAAQFFGVTRTREIYEQAIASLPDKYVRDIALKYAELERRLGEIDRARAIYVHTSQYCDPRSDTTFWPLWHNFEVRHGNQDTYREMLRVKRSVLAQYNTQVNLMSAEMLAASKGDELRGVAASLKAAGAPEDEMAALERQAAAEETTGRAARIKAAPGADVRFTAQVAVNPEEISLEGEAEGMEEAEGEEAEGEEKKQEPSLDIRQKKVPAAVFGSIATAGEEGGEEKKVAHGALARLRAAKRGL